MIELHTPWRRIVAGMLVQSTVRRVILAALAGLLLGLLAAAPAGAGPAWRTPVDISAASGESAPAQVAVDPRGNAVVVWEQSNGNNIIVQVAVRAAGGTWQAPVNLSAPGRDASDPQVAVDAQGNAVAVWRRRDNADNAIVQGSVRAAGGSWQAPVNLSAAGHTAVSPQVAVDPQGNAVAVWHRFKSERVLVVQCAVRAVGGSWQAPVELSASGQERSVVPQVAVGANGDAVAVWKYVGASSIIVKGAARPAGGPWQAPVDIAAAGAAGPLAIEVFPQVAVDAEGNAVAVWDHPTGSTSIVRGAVRAAGGAWQTPVTLSAAGQNAETADIAVDPRGNAVAVWGRSIGTTSMVQGAVRAAGATWQAPINLSTASQNAVIPRVAVDPQGNAVAVWSIDRFSTRASSSIVQGAMRPAGGIWQAPVDIATADQLGSPDIAVDAQGTAVAVWGRDISRPRYLVEGDGGSVIQGADYAAARPPAVATSVARLRLSPSAFRAGRTVRAVPPRATQVSYSLNVAASVRFTVQRLSTGRTVAARCVKATSSNRRRKSCVRYVRVRGSFTRRRPAGADRFAFNGDISHTGTLLKSARYRLVATPITNGRPGTPAHALFRIVR